MDPFFTYVAIGALVVLTLILILIGISLSKLQTLDSFPPTQNTCPDYWDVSSNPAYCGVPTDRNAMNRGYITLEGNEILKTSKKNVGMCLGTNFGCSSDNVTYLDLQDKSKGSQFQYVKLSENPKWTSMYPGAKERCAKKKWANTLNITWDGVSNYNGC